mmetsp:Transcript_30410/g.105047  ORF Transcript_30410/g.105047 Transcript_30410/m.105047 type:complete len:207 (-) Transcript_30410:3086-3706(-)
MSVAGSAPPRSARARTGRSRGCWAACVAAPSSRAAAAATQCTYSSGDRRCAASAAAAKAWKAGARPHCAASSASSGQSGGGGAPPQRASASVAASCAWRLRNSTRACSVARRWRMAAIACKGKETLSSRSAAPSASPMRPSYAAEYDPPPTAEAPSSRPSFETQSPSGAIQTPSSKFDECNVAFDECTVAGSKSSSSPAQRFDAAL